MPIKKSKENIFCTEKSIQKNTTHSIKVGCGDVSIPLNVHRKDGSNNSSQATVDVNVDLNSTIYGSHISNIVNILNKEPNNSLYTLTKTLLDSTETKLYDKSIKISYDFVYFLRKKAIVSKEESWISYKTVFTAEKVDDVIKYYLRINIPYTSLCPTSKEISDYGAHNQRSLAEIEVELTNFHENCDFWIEDVVYIVDNCVSCPVFNVGDLTDEAFQTEMMYENPMFVEDIALKIAKCLDKCKDTQIKGYNLTLNHYDSINDYTTKAVLQ